MSSPDNIDGNILVNLLFVQQAVEAGIAATIRGIVNGQPMGLIELVVAVRTALWDVNRPLAEGVNQYTMLAILNYLSLIGQGIAVSSQQIPEALDMDGPVGTWVSYNAGTLSVTWTNPPAGFASQIVVDGVIVGYSEARDDVDGNADATFNVSLSAGAHVVRVVYRRVADGALSRLGVVANLNV
ncbi:MAG: hypothetical protein D6712_03710 [Chloroflexi bacterium]|nr:MAG: hypothetical protein D6712_03710 [Chloroflexota bacterium]